MIARHGKKNSRFFSEKLSCCHLHFILRVFLLCFIAFNMFIECSIRYIHIDIHEQSNRVKKDEYRWCKTKTNPYSLTGRSSSNFICIKFVQLPQIQSVVLFLWPFYLSRNPHPLPYLSLPPSLSLYRCLLNY